jgi:trimethylamine monooxygenase
MGFRDNAYRSIMTGKMSPKHHTPWLKAMDDSMESYLKESQPVQSKAADKQKSMAKAK